MIVELLRLSLLEEADVFAIRHRGREVAAAVGLDDQDQIRVATALSEIGRDALGSEDGTAIFAIDFTSDPTLVVTISITPNQRDSESSGLAASGGVAAAARLVDSVDVVTDGTVTVIRLRKRISGTNRPTRRDADVLRARLSAVASISPLDVLRSQNQDLLAALDQVNDKQADLVQLNAELEETNRGVMAIYRQLSDELEETNRGVVALYAELDDKTLQLQKASEAKSRFLASVSHELRTPVNSVIALQRLLLDPEGDALTDDQRRQLELIGGSASNLLVLVNQLLDLAKAESGKLDPDLTEVDLCSVFSELRGALRPLVPEGVTLDIEDPSGFPSVQTDRVLLEQVLRNLLSNALKFTETGGVVMKARLRESAQHVEMTITDTGIGISPEDHERIFEEFYQVRGPLQTRRRGTGLGLPYVRRVVEVLGAHLDLQSTVGQGTTVTVRHPLQWSAALGALRLPLPHEAIEDHHVGTVLVVDDDPAFRQVLRGMLQGLAERVLEAGDGFEALSSVRANRPDVMFLDLRMPGLDGAQVLAEMGEDSVLRDIPVVIVTSVDLDVVRGQLGRAAALVAKANVTRDHVRAALSQVKKRYP